MDKKLDELQKLEEQLNKKETEIKSMLSQIKAENGDNEMEIERGGEKVTVTEKDLWNERTDMYATKKGRQQADSLLKQKYPGLFKKMQEKEELGKKVSKKFEEVWGFPFSQVTPSRLSLMVKRLVDYYND